MSTIPRPKKIHIIGGGTNSFIANHFALSAPAYGGTAKQLSWMFKQHKDNKMEVVLHLTKMAGGTFLETPEDIDHLVSLLIMDPDTRVIIFNAAIVDFKPLELIEPVDNYGAWDNVYPDIKLGKYKQRLSSHDYDFAIRVTTQDKIINRIRKERKDIFLVSFKTTCDATRQEQFTKGLTNLKASSSNLVFVNDTHPDRRVEKAGDLSTNGIITPEESSYWFDSRESALKSLVEMILLRTNLHFTRSTVIAANPVSWHDPAVPSNLREVVDHCIDNNAYKSFGQSGATVGHFAVKLSPTEFLTSIRKTNFNNLKDIGLVRVKTDGPDHIYAYGAKPSVGGQSQRLIFDAHPELDCIVHFHCPLKYLSWSTGYIKPRSQFGVECGAHECGANTVQGLERYSLDNGQFVWVTHLDRHGPNIVFSKDIDSEYLIKFINDHWDLSKKTDGLNGV